MKKIYNSIVKNIPTKKFDPLKKYSITVMRHAETTWNAPKKKLQGQSPNSQIVLSDKGRKEIFTKLSSIKTPDILISSPLLRCKQTAEEWFNVSIEEKLCTQIYHDGLKEVNVGTLEGLYVDELQDKNKELWQLWKKQPLKFPGFPEGETLQEFQTRILNTFSELCNQYAYNTDKNICIITHGGPMSVLKCFLDQKDLSYLWNKDFSNLERLELTTKDILSLSQITLNQEQFFMKNEFEFFKKEQKTNSITYLKCEYPENHWARHLPNEKDKNFIATLKINDVLINLKLNSTDSRGYRGIVGLVTEKEEDLPSTFNRRYTIKEKQALNTALNILASAYEQYGMVVQTEIAGNNSQSIKDGVIQLGNEKEPSLLHGHIIGRGNPNSCYIDNIPLRGPKAGELFNMRGDGKEEGNKSKEKWQTGEMEVVATLFANTLTQLIKSNEEFNKAEIASIRKTELEENNSEIKVIKN